MVLGAYIALITFFAGFPLLEELEIIDHLPELRRLYAAGMYDKAILLGRDMLEAGICRDPREVGELTGKAEKRSNSLSGNSFRFLRGFVSGKSDTSADAAGAIASDLLVYGDVRDVLVQTGLWAFGSRNDPVLLAISGAGVLFEALPLIDWFPAMLKYFHRTGAFTGEFTGHLLKSIKKFKQHGKIEKKIFLELSALCRKCGIGRCAGVMKFVKNPEELSTALRLAQESPAKLHLAVKATGGDVLRSGFKVSSSRLLHAALRGKAGLLTLKRAKLLAAVKIVSSGRLGAFIRHGARHSGTFRTVSFTAAGLLFFCGLAISGCGMIKKFRKKSEKENKKTV